MNTCTLVLNNAVRIKASNIYVPGGHGKIENCCCCCKTVPVEQHLDNGNLVKGQNDQKQKEDLRNMVHTALTAETTEHLLSTYPSGTYLLRNSSDPSAFLTLSVRTKYDIVHMRIYNSTAGVFYLGSGRKQRRTFATVADLLLFYRHKAIASFHGDDNSDIVGGSKFCLKLPLTTNAACRSLRHFVTQSACPAMNNE